MSSISNIPHESIEIDIGSLELSASRLICLIKPTWIKKNLIFKKLGTDFNNTYYSIYPSDNDDEQSGIVIKIYSINSDIYTDHKKELELMNEFIHHGIAPRILLTFNNGYFSNYIHGNILDTNDEHTPQLIAHKLAEFHSFPLKSTNSIDFIDKLQQFIDLFTKKNVTLDEKLKEPHEDNPTFLSSLKSAVGLNTIQIETLDQLELQLKDTSWAELSTEINFIRTVLNEHWSKHNLPIVVCLNNLHIDNFLYNSITKTTTIIDFDHCLNNYFLFDIVSYFIELTRNNPENKYPERHIQKSFLIEYLKQTSLNLSSLVYDHLKPTDMELERLCDLCGLLIAPIHLYWALWAFIQGLLNKSNSTFDYIKYGETRLHEYQKYKQNFFLPLYPHATN
ncbi:unnamed protein product [Adineta steineri]|uniref:ethanolamine kinase n=1 Tax=Adineta steineri TaxID=433720 RepID=A0A818S4M1_9BILA|nr:unnamed protein product [Adineta steineri]CAF3660898.1 unnamed protein product [Adineta steineri]